MARLRIAGLAAPLALFLSAGAPAATGTSAGDPEPLTVVSEWTGGLARRSPVEFRSEMLDQHNKVRRDHGVAPLRWDDALARSAARYAQELADEEKFEHSSAEGEDARQGENLWMGTASAFTYTEMTSSWLEEGAAYKPGRFPDVSRTGSWQDVGHYTQMIWSGTREVGCAIASNKTDDYLVCRYAPAGNVMGREPTRVLERQRN